ncbi:MAG: DUF4834 family protein [Bacteroidales bacterium]|nr:DUF4834 family protein [Candidatus Physcousia equi]
MGCLLNFFLFIFIFAAIQGVRLWWTVRKVMRGQMGGSRSNQSERQQSAYRGEGVYRDPSAQARQTAKGSTPRKKVYGDDEGEYVDFEEVKD